MAEVVTTANQNNFSSRSEMVQWINEILKVNIKKIEHLGTGAVFCQLFDYICPGKVQMSKVNWKAKYENDYILNFKVLQVAFDKMNINKPLDVNKLIKCKYQDNLELLQWIKKYHDQFRKTPEKPYDPISSRKGQIFSCEHFQQTEKVPLPPSNHSANVQTGAQQAALSIIDGATKPPPSIAVTTAPQASRHITKKSQTTFIPGQSSHQYTEIGKQNLSQSCQSSISNISMDQDNPILDEVAGSVGQGFLQTVQQENKRQASASNYEKDALVTRLRDERDFYYKKIETIDHMLDGIIDNTSLTPLQIKTFIKTILYTTRENILTVHDDGTISLTDQNSNPIALGKFETFEGLEDLQNEILTTNEIIQKSDSKKSRNQPSSFTPVSSTHDQLDDFNRLNSLPNKPSIITIPTSPSTRFGSEVLPTSKTPKNNSNKDILASETAQNMQNNGKQISAQFISNSNRLTTESEIIKLSDDQSTQLAESTTSMERKTPVSSRIPHLSESQFKFENNLLMHTNNDDEDLLGDLE